MNTAVVTLPQPRVLGDLISRSRLHDAQIVVRRDDERPQQRVIASDKREERDGDNDRTDERRGDREETA